jgi:SPP1 family predicted phage head-tail adaptor
MLVKKDKKISILKWEVVGTGDYGDDIYDWVPIPNGENIWAYYRHMSAKEFYAARQVNVEETVIFIINWRNDVNTAMRIEYKGRQYEITRIDDFEGYKQDLKIYAKIVN